MDPMTRIADALERLADRLAPQPASADPANGAWFVWDGAGLAAVPPPRTAPLSLYVGVDAQASALLDNARRHARGLPAHDVLLWGARGMGKSSLVRAVHRVLLDEAMDVALVQLGQPDLATLPRLFARLAAVPRRFTLFLDDVALAGDDAQVHALRSLLDGGVMARPDHVRLVITSNRRNLVPQVMADRAADAVNPRDLADDSLALADRFGLKLGFHACDQDQYLAICAAYAGAHGLPHDPEAALRFAAARGARSGRVAWHFAVDQAGRAGVRLP